MNRQEIIERLKKPFCPALLSDEEWGVTDELQGQFQKPIEPNTWTNPIYRATRLSNITYRLDPAYTEPKEPVNKTSKSFNVSNGAMVMVTTNGGLIGFDSSQGDIDPKDALKIAQEIMNQSFLLLWGVK